MKFYISEVKLWFAEELEPKSYHLKPNKINVITGSATKGKSSFLSIIDYCLLAPYTRLVEAIINENVSWYGIRFTIGEDELLIARKAPYSDVISPELYYSQDTVFSDVIPIPNIELGELFDILNEKWGISSELLELGNLKKKQKIDLSFRSFLPYCVISESIIAEEERFYDSTFFSDTATVSETFPIALGLNTEYIQNSKRVTTLKSEIRNLESSKKKINAVDNGFRNKLELLYQQAFNNGLLEEQEVSILSNEEIINILSSLSKQFDLLADNSKIIREREELGKRRWRVIRQKNNYRKCIDEYNLYVENISKTKDSLKPIEYLYENKEELLQSVETIRFIDALTNSLDKIKQQINIPQKPGNDVYARIKELEMEIALIEQEINKRAHIKNEYFRFSDIFKLVGVIETELKFAQEKLLPPFDKEGKLQELRSEFDTRSKAPDLDTLITELKNTLEREIQSIYNQITTMDRYNNYTVLFDMERYVLKVKEPNTLFECQTIGSQSNYMFLHLSFFLGLHKFSSMDPQSLIPTFLFIDQPSKPYLNTDLSKIKDQGDAKKLYEAFYIMNEFVKFEVEQNKNTFQIFMIEHTEPSFWETSDKLDYFHTVDQFFGDKGLIPDYVIKN